MTDAQKVVDALLNYPLKIYDTNPADRRYYLYGKEGHIVNGRAVVIPDFRLREETILPPAKDPEPENNPLPRKEVYREQEKV
jgi:hypothetical protein